MMWTLHGALEAAQGAGEPTVLGWLASSQTLAQGLLQSPLSLQPLSRWTRQQSSSLEALGGLSTGGFLGAMKQ